MRGEVNEMYAAERDEARWARWQTNDLADAGAPRVVGGVYRTGEPEDDR